MEVTQPSCLFFFTLFVGYYYEEENVSHTRFTPTYMMRRLRRRKIHHCHHHYCHRILEY